MSKNVETIQSLDLARVHGGQQQPPSYNAQDLRSGLQGAAVGAARGGPIGAVTGFGWGVMKRNVGELFSATRDLYNEYQRGRELDKQRPQK